MEQYRQMTVQCKGIKKRCRKTENHGFTIKIKYPITLTTEIIDSIKIDAKKVLIDNMKSYENNVTIRMDFITEEDRSSGFISKIWEPFSSNNIVFKLELA